MKKYLIITLANLLISTLIFAQSADGFKYQAIIRDAAGNVNANASVQMEISILQGSADGLAVFTETHLEISNSFDLVNLTIGSQNPSDFNLIDWAIGPYFIKIVIDGIEFGTSQLLSVPYALHAESSEKATLAETAENYKETDPLYTNSSAATITQAQIENWTNKLSEFAETDPDFNASVAAGITSTQIESWTNKLDTFLETDPEFAASLAKGITATDTAFWNSKLDDFAEMDPKFLTHPSSGITVDDITKWKALWIWYTTNEMGYLKANTPAGGITAADTANWNRMSNQSIKLSDVIAVNDSANGQIKNLSNPTHAKDAVTKIYLDSIMAQFYLDVHSKVKDVDNHTYNTVDIGNQTCMAENLKTTKYNDGTSIPLGSQDSATWVDMTSPAYCWYENDSATYASTYGALYNWFTVDTNILCPVGWHIPDTTDWGILMDFVGGRDIAGGKLKEIGTSHWATQNTGADNSFNFTALPGGIKAGGNFMGINNFGVWWTTNTYLIEAILSLIWYDEAGTGYVADVRNIGASVRCIKD